LIVFAHAGGSASFFQSWTAHIPEHTELCAIQLPGRENRFSEPLLTTFEAILDAAEPALTAVTDRPFAILGHSFGGLLAFALTQRLETKNRRPTALAVSAFRAAHLPPKRRLSELSDEQFLASITELGGTPGDVMKNPELLELVLPALRADFAAVDSYRPAACKPIAAPLWAFGGAADPWVDAASLGAWSQHTSGDFRLRLFPGGHFYLLEHGPVLASELANTLP
jgi:surfactin synthase thioesterase subunit